MNDEQKKLIKANKTKKALEEIIEALETLTNNMSFDYEKASKILSERFGRVHRTSQQDTIRLLAMMITNIAEHTTDLRNEAAIKWCKKVSEIDVFFPRV